MLCRSVRWPFGLLPHPSCWLRLHRQRRVAIWAHAPAPATVSDTTTNGGQPGLIVLTTFPGDSGPGPKDNPDNTGGVGPDHVVDFTNMNVVIHDKQTGKAIKHVTQTEFWKNVTPGFNLPTLNDPRMLYDALCGRWFGVIAELIPKSSGYLAVSETSDPTKAWRGVKLPMVPTDVGMKLGVDKNGLYITFIIMTNNTHTMHGCYAIPKADLIGPGAPEFGQLAKIPRPRDRVFSRDGS